MKKLTYLCCLFLALTMSSCNWFSDPLELVYPGTDLSGKKDEGGTTLTPEEQAIEDFKNVVATTDYGWKLTASLSDNENVSIYFIFDFENNKIKVVSDRTLEPKTVDLKLTVNKDNKIVIDLTGTDMELLGDNALIVDGATDGNIACSGATTGGTYNLVFADEDEVNNLMPLSEKMQKSGLVSGLIVSEAGANVAHYYLDIDSKTIYVTYWKDGYTKFADASKFTSGTDNITTDVKLSEVNIELKGIEKTSTGYKLDGTNLAGCKLTANQVAGMDVTSFVVNGDDANGGFHFTLFPNHNNGDDASEVFLNEMQAWGDLTSWEVACGSWSKSKGWAPGFCFSTSSTLPGWQQAYEYIVWGDNYTKSGEPGRFYFTEKNPGILAPSGQDAYKDVKKHLPKILDFLESKDGLFVVFENKNITGKGYSYIYLFDPVKKLFTKMAKDGRFGNGAY